MPIVLNEKFVESIPEDLDEGLEHIISAYWHYLKGAQNMGLNARHDESVDFYFILEGFCKSHGLQIETVEFGTDKDKNILRVRRVFDEVRNMMDNRKTLSYVEKSQQKYQMVFENVFCYEFTEGDLNKVQTIVNELREIITSSELFAADHKDRILRRLEKLQSELHKKVSDLDRFWGLIGDAGVVIGKFGQDAKPIVDRIKEIADIVWRTQSTAEELPSGTNIPFLSRGEEASSE